MRALIFDLDDTLVVEDAAATAAFESVAGSPERAALVRGRARDLWRAAPVHPYCLRVGISSSEALWCRFEGDAPEIRWLRDWAPSHRREAWQDIGDPDRFGEERRARHENFGDVGVLDELDGPLVLLTNGASCLQREKLAASGLADRFDAVVISGDLGVGKPEAAIFRHALDLVGASEGVMIGDSVERDIEGALNAGLEGVWLNRSGDPGPDVPQIASLRELAARLAA